jgi:hypothetical protein
MSDELDVVADSTRKTEIYKQTLLAKAIKQIQNSNPSTGEFVLRELCADHLVVGYLTYYTEEGVCNDFGESLGLTEDDIGEPCEYWEMTLSIELDGSVVECFSGTDAVWNHPNWARIIADSSVIYDPTICNKCSGGGLVQVDGELVCCPKCQGTGSD